MSNSFKIKVEGNEKSANALKVAFATTNQEDIDAHFGGAKEFAIYSVTKEGYSLDEVLKTDEKELDGDQKTEFKVKALDGINIMYCESIGPTAAAKVIRAGIHPMKVTEATKIDDSLKMLQAMLNGNPPPWIKKIMQSEA